MSLFNNSISARTYKKRTGTRCAITLEGRDGYSDANINIQPEALNIYGTHTERLNSIEKSTGVIERIVPNSAANFKVYFKNKYGVWVHRMTPIV